MSKSHIVDLHVGWFRSQRWIVIDDEDIRWPYEVANDRLVLTSGCSGLRCPFGNRQAPYGAAPQLRRGEATWLTG